jgi:hypothetical protein
MNSNLDRFHHLGLITSAFNVTIQRYERLGFSFTPLSLPEFPVRSGETPQPVGVGNRTAIFRSNYLEVLGRASQDARSRHALPARCRSRRARPNCATLDA